MQMENNWVTVDANKNKLYQFPNAVTNMFIIKSQIFLVQYN